MTDNADIRRVFEQVSQQNHQLRRRVEKLERTPADLRNAAIDGGRGLTIKSESETIRFGDNGVEHLEGPDPERPEAPFVDTGGEAAKIQLSGLDAYGYVAQRNFKQAHIHVSQQESFEPSRGTFAGYVAQADGSMTHRLPGGEWYVGVVWENMAGVLSPMSDTTLADVAPLVDADEIQEALDAAAERLEEAEQDFQEGNEQRKAEIENLRDTVIPGLESKLSDKADQSALDDLASGLAENEQNLSDARDRLTSAEKTLAPLPGQMTETREQATEAREAAEAAEARAVEANNRSMTRLANGNFENGLLYWDVTDVDISGDAHSGTQSALIGSGGSISPASSMPVVEGQIWELSLYHKTNGGGTVNIRMESITEDGTRTIFEEWSIESAGWADTGALRATIPADVDLMSFTVTGDGTRVDDITLRDVTDVVRLEEAARTARKKAETVEETIEGSGGIRERLGTAEENISKKVDSTRIDEIDDQVETALSGPVTHDRLRAGEGAFDEAFVDELWVRNVRALAAELASLIVASANMVPNGDLTQGDQFWRLDNATIVQDDTPPGYKYAIRREPNDGVVRNETSFPVQGGEEYLFEMWIKADKPNSSFYWDMRDQDGVHVGQDGGTTENLEPEGYAHSSTWRPVSDLTVPTEWTRVRTILRPSESVDSLRLATTYFNHANGTERDATVWIAGVRVAPRAGAEVIVDGTIGTRHLNVTGEMTAAIVNADKSKVIELIAEDLIAQNATLINTSMQNLSVTERADFAKAYAQELWAELGVFDRLDAREGWVGGVALEDGAVGAEQVNVEQLFSDEAVIDKVWSDIVRARMLTAEEAIIGGALIKDNTIDVAKLNVTEELTAAVAQFLEVKAGMIEANAIDADAISAGAIEGAHLSGRIIKGEHIQGDTFTGQTFDGGTFTGSTFQTDSLPNHGLKFSADGIHGWDDNGEKTLQITGEISKDMKDPDAGNFLTGRFYTNGKDLPGIILNPDYGPDSHQGPGVWFSEDGWVDASQPAIWVNKSDFYNLTIRGKRWDNGSRSHVELQGGINVTEGGVIVDNGTVQSDYGAFGRIEASGQADFRSISYFHGIMRYPGKLERTGSSNVQIYSSHDNFAKITSVRASKVNIEDVEHNRPERILDLQPRIWLDRTDLKEALGDDYADYVWAGNQYSGPTVDEEKLKNKLGYIPRRIPGLVAEEVVAAGLDEYAIYDEEEDGTETLQSISYDRLWTLLIPLVREQRDKINTLEQHNADLEDRLARLEAMMK